VPPGTPFPPGFTDLQSWTRDASNGGIEPDWLRIGTDITGQGPFNAAFVLNGVAVPGPIAGAGLPGLAAGMRCPADAGASPSEDYYYSDDDTYVAFEPDAPCESAGVGVGELFNGHDATAAASCAHSGLSRRGIHALWIRSAIPIASIGAESTMPMVRPYASCSISESGSRKNSIAIRARA
jgi:hypothetical protein